MPTPSPVLTVSQLNRHVRSWLEQGVGVIRVAGELSNVSQPTSGHLYFTLKDATAQLRCAYFRHKQPSGGQHSILHGQHVVVSGMLSLYEARGDYQLIVEHVEEAGLGDRFQQLEQLKAKLQQEGLFDPVRKQALPRYPRTIGIMTSPSGAALHDILTTLARRFPQAHVIVYACDVQGNQAAPQLQQAIVFANQTRRCDVLILARGGGSIEDLWAFNDEQLVRAMAASRIPIVSGVGHETDFTLADFVADVRAATPTAAAETVTPNVTELLLLYASMERQLIEVIRRYLISQKIALRHQVQQLISPKQRIQLQVHHVAALEQQLRQVLRNILARHQQRFARVMGTLQAVSPLATLERGYAIALHDHTVLTKSQDIHTGDIVTIRLAQGQIFATVTETLP